MGKRSYQVNEDKLSYDCYEWIEREFNVLDEVWFINIVQRGVMKWGMRKSV